EIYVPTQLAKGKLLYRDVWYTYGPLSPYLNAFLLRVFGVHLLSFYIASFVNLFLCTWLLFRIARRLLPPAGVFSVCAVFLLQAFHPNIFNFILPYAFAATYGFLLTLFCLELTIRAVEKGSRTIFWPAVVAGLALIDKPEFGFACVGCIALYIAWRVYRERSWKFFFILAGSCVPGLLLAAGVYAYFFSIRGAHFILAENFMSTPQSYFYRTFGHQWLEGLGAPVSFHSIWVGAIKTARTVFAWAVLCLVLSWMLRRARSIELAVAAGLAVAGVSLSLFLARNGLAILLQQKFRALFLPVTAGVITTVLVIVSTVFVVRRRHDSKMIIVALIAGTGCLLAFRCLLHLTPLAYPIYFNALSFLCAVFVLFLFASFFFRQLPPTRSRWAMNVLLVLPLIAGLLWVADLYNWKEASSHRAWLSTPEGLRVAELPGPPRLVAHLALQTPRGTIKVPEFKRDPYLEAIAFMKTAGQAGKRVVVMPEDVSLYFFSEVDCPMRVIGIIPYVLDPDQPTTDYINELDAKQVDYILITDRHSPEYHLTYFGRDYNQRIMEFIQQHYRQVKTIGNYSLDLENRDHWGALVYERR
ncbi:MAG TPA: glycosyltransferase family 39 protein, partial [Chthoniobacterales bacterium]